MASTYKSGSIPETERLLNSLEQRMIAARRDLEQAKSNLDWQIAKDIFDAVAQQYTSVASELERQQKEMDNIGIQSGVIGVTSIRNPVNNIPTHRLSFIGRAREMREIGHILTSDNPFVVIDGLGGVGKSALASATCHSFLEVGIFDTVVWLSAKDRSLTVEDIIDTAAQVIGIYPKIQDSHLELRRKVTIEALENRRSIFVLDNLNVRSWLPISEFVETLSEKISIIITSRERLSIPAVEYSLAPLSMQESLDLLKAFGELVRSKTLLRATDAQLREICESSGGLPLAIVWAAGHISQLGQTLERVVAELKNAKGEIFEKLFGDIVNNLSINARHLLAVLSLLPVPATQLLLEQTTDMKEDDIEEALDQLLNVWLIDPSDEITKIYRRYEVHALTRAYATAHEIDVLKQSELVLRNAARYYTYIVKHRAPLDHSFIRQEISHAFAVADKLEEMHYYDDFQKLVNEISVCLDQYGLMEQRLNYGLRAVNAAQKLADRETELWHLTYNVAHCLMNKGEFEEAERMLVEALDWAEAKNNKLIKAIAIGTLGAIKRRRDRDWGKAADMLEQALLLWTELDNRYFMIISKLVLATPKAKLGDYESAKTLLEIALSEASVINNEELASIALGLLGRISFEQNEITKAKEYYSEALKLCQRTGRISGEPHSYLGFAQIAEKEGKLSETLHYYQLARNGFHEVHNSELEKVCQTAIDRVKLLMPAESSDTEPDLEIAVKKTILAYEQLAAKYSERWDSFTNSIAMKKFSDLLDKQNPLVLDLACGTGRDLVLFHQIGVPSVGIDLSQAMLRISKRRELAGKVCQSDMALLPFSNDQFSGVWASACLLHIPRQAVQSIVREITRVVRDAVFISVVEGTGFSWDNCPNNTERFFAYYSKDEINQILEDSGLRVLELWNPEPPNSYPKWLYLTAVKKGILV